MKIFSQNDKYKLYQGNMLDMLEVIEPNSIDSIITDPPYGLTSITKRFGKENSAECKYGKDGSFARLSRGFMGKEWDGSGIEYNIETWQKCYEVLKPGGYLLAFGGSRTFHRIACAIEDAGFEIRDTIMWLYGSGFPKSQNISKMLDKKFGKERPIIGYTTNAGIAKNAKPDSTGSHIWSGNIRSDEPITNLAKQWQGWGTCLKPSFEPIIVARKPFKGSLVDNVIKYDVGGINIDECRVGTEERAYKGCGKSNVGFIGGAFENGSKEEIEYNVRGRFPANTILTYDETPSDERLRYFYCAKASKKDRDEGLDEFEEKEYILGCNGATLDNIRKKGHYGNGGNGLSTIKIRKNTHPTVKPTELMQYLVRLVSPNGATILDPFNGSGSTGKAVMYENRERNKNYKYIGIELTKEYLPISKARIEYVCGLNEEELKDKQMTIFDIKE